MQDIIFKDTTQNREIPTRIYIPEKHQGRIPTVIFGPGYQSQEELKSPNTKMVYKDYDFLAQYFIKNNYAFICIQHDMLGDNDGLETVDHTIPQYKALNIYMNGGRRIYSM